MPAPAAQPSDAAPESATNERCYRCFWPKRLCWCGSIRPMATRTKIVLLMHPKEWKEQRTGTGRLTHLCLADSELIMGIGFDDHERVQEMIRDPENFPTLLYPGPQARALPGGLAAEELGGRRLVVFVLDGTWSCARKMLRLSPSLQRLPRLMFPPAAPSKFVIKQQPAEGCLCTLEATHELLLALERAGLERYPDPAQLPELLQRMQSFLIQCASDPAKSGYRRKRGYGTPETRRVTRGPESSRPLKLFGGRADKPVSEP
ncbi:MAG TPA: tRNA-uridine aminocarboxypropyltransferase [Opitutaceae bacterium]|nr:tRNA-uridine aminocarboxypropyltransferase [Opitutaceae bacterium]